MNELDSIIKRWKISHDYNDSFNQFQNRVLIELGNSLKKISLSPDQFLKEFTFLIGEFDPDLLDIDYVSGQGFISEYFVEFFESIEDPNQFFYHLQIFLDVLINEINNDDLNEVKKGQNSYLYSQLFKSISRAVDLSPGLNIIIKLVGEKIILYPSGADLLDQEVINSNLAWLEKYPQVLEKFSNSLELFLRKDKSKFRNLLDDLRFSLELLLKEILNNKKSLENQESFLITWLSSKNQSSQIINMYKQLIFGPYCIFQNDSVKHGEKFKENEIEFMIYLTAVFMRFLLSLDDKEN